MWRSLQWIAVERFWPVPDKVLILGGTREAAQLARNLCEKGDEVITSLAGRTKEPAPLAGQTRIGGFGGAEKMAGWITENGITRLIDATHPFAVQISHNARIAARLADIPLEIRTRKPWQIQDGDNWQSVSGPVEAANAIPTKSRVLLALGSQHLSAFYHRDDVHFTVRMVDPPEQPLPFHSHTILAGKPSSHWRDEMQLLKDQNITHIVCRNSGGAGANAKIRAARELGLPVIMIGRPE